MRILRDLEALPIRVLREPYRYGKSAHYWHIHFTQYPGFPSDDYGYNR